jgi:SnoaL-like protein
MRVVRVLLVAALLGLGVAVPASASPAGHATPTTPTTSAPQCARQFDRAVAAYVRTTDRRDAAGFNALLHPDVTIIFANGGVLAGKPDSAAFIDDFFADPGWTQTFHELRRSVQGCRTGFVLFDSVYAVPAQNRTAPLVIGVTFTYAHGTWLVLHNQDSTGPASS